MSTLRTDTLQTTDSAVTVQVANLVDTFNIGGLLTPFLTNYEITLPNVAALKTLDWSLYKSAHTQGYYNPRDGGHGTYNKDTSDTTSANNNVTVIVANDGTRLKLEHTGVVSAKQAGAKGDGSDDLAAFQAALAASGVQVVYVPRSAAPYTISGSLTVPAGKSIVGDGAQASVLAPSSLTSNFITLGDGAVVRDVYVAGSASRTAGAFIITSGTGWKVKDVEFNNFHICIQTSGTIGYIDKVKAVSATTTTGSCIRVTDGGELYIRDVLVDTGTAPLAGFHMTKGGGIWMSNCDFIHCQNGVLLQAAGTDTITNFFLDGVACDSSSNSGYNFVTFGSGAIRSIGISNSWSATNNVGVLIQGNGGDIDGVWLTNFRSINNKFEGISLNGDTRNFSMVGGVVSGNSQATPGVSDGINVGANISNVTIKGVRVGPCMTFADTQFRQIHFNAGAGAFNTVEGCNVQTSRVPIVFDPTDARNSVRNNPGATDRFIEGVTTDASGYATIPHGLGAIPNHVKLDIINSATPYFIQLDSMTQTNFRVRIWTQAGAVAVSQPFSIGWHALL